ncbi:MAG TPA: two-component sensor histidine kinase [Ktedonobacter sp.]|jgi:C4-dicarboxylate-specific signal transduction histidine kinase|nr:two-component sensor histidine kinase [Ktedonobacter sp.]HAG97306.1 two-component sensor histidine kinase [Ktedonobacter sp.]HAT43563.1 two-component sensor histidine kinase [Ktedonobacter sp.]HBE24253.1 two-component sensor histidine kinase [Ktedonobacter sp.]HCF86690.1 two-component sensor histidine kinase [Ktedonobacter sp.]
MDLKVGEALAAASETSLLKEIDWEQLLLEYNDLLEQKKSLEMRVHKSEERRRALMHILSDLNNVNKKLANQRKAMIHILADYEHDRSRLARQTERLDNSRRALMHILQDSHKSNLRLESSRKAMIHIMSDLKVTTEDVQQREHELREKQEQLVQAGKLATLGELTTGVAHELNNPLNNIGLFIGNVIDQVELGKADPQLILHELHSAMQQVYKATEIISHLRTFGRAASVSREPVAINQVIERAISLMYEQLRLRQIEVQLHFSAEDVIVIGNAIQLEQVFINLLSNARDAMAVVLHKVITITCVLHDDVVDIYFRDTGPGIPVGFEQRIFDPFFTTKDVGAGTGLGLSITYGIIKEHQGSIAVKNRPGEGALFLIQLPLKQAS